MKRITVHANLDKEDAGEALAELIEWLKERGLDVRRSCWEEDEEEGRRALAGCDLLIVLGGDGTLLSAARYAYPAEVPVLGVNFGHLGFLTAIGVDEMYSALEEVLAGRYRLEPRLMLRAEVDAWGETPLQTHYALNDVVMRDTGGRSLEIETRIDDVLLGSFRADGLIISTPTGSSAYSLSAGGPIVEPSLKALMATAICPHAFAIRPLLFPAHQTLETFYRSRGSGAHLAIDGQVMVDLEPEQRVRVHRAQRPIHFVLVENRSFYEVLRSKLRWGGA
ncbi:MAG: NAD(+)/NADH kinase [Candidatus Eisenbacteria bacterium]|uniref:NAD kinase n=1 Tax=Eiseniibacteriota bacterium TaxID=2212470 RepID=A0A956LY11_UNCEI|nr:NAD(+)/NADH kinase [Candidatus Eisenbacteria bacterium]